MAHDYVDKFKLLDEAVKANIAFKKWKADNNVEKHYTKAILKKEIPPMPQISKELWEMLFLMAHEYMKSSAVRGYTQDWKDEMLMGIGEIIQNAAPKFDCEKEAYIHLSREEKAKGAFNYFTKAFQMECIRVTKGLKEKDEALQNIKLENYTYTSDGLIENDDTQFMPDVEDELIVREELKRLGIDEEMKIPSEMTAEENRYRLDNESDDDLKEIKKLMREYKYNTKDFMKICDLCEKEFPTRAYKVMFCDSCRVLANRKRSLRLSRGEAARGPLFIAYLKSIYMVDGVMKETPDVKRRKPKKEKDALVMKEALESVQNKFKEKEKIEMEKQKEKLCLVCEVNIDGSHYLRKFCDTCFKNVKLRRAQLYSIYRNDLDELAKQKETMIEKMNYEYKNGLGFVPEFKKRFCVDCGADLKGTGNKRKRCDVHQKEAKALSDKKYKDKVAVKRIQSKVSKFAPDIQEEANSMKKEEMVEKIASNISSIEKAFENFNEKQNARHLKRMVEKEREMVESVKKEEGVEKIASTKSSDEKMVKKVERIDITERFKIKVKNRRNVMSISISPKKPNIINKLWKLIKGEK